MNARDLYNQFLEKLQTIYETAEADNILDWVFENITGLKRWERKLNPSLAPNIQQKLQHALDELLRHRPVQYVLNEAWFYKNKYYVDESVLIPRPETEQLVEWIVADVKEYYKSSNISILDIGTGSGCIPISLKKELSQSSVTSVDVSEAALAVARKNAINLKAEIKLKQLNFLDEKSWNAFEKYDVIVSNPPYIPYAEKNVLAKNVTDHEPALALFVADDDAFIFYRKIAEFGKNHLKVGANIYVEIHEQFAKQTLKVFQENGYECLVQKDWYGRDRMIKATPISAPQMPM